MAVSKIKQLQIDNIYAVKIEKTVTINANSTLDVSLEDVVPSNGRILNVVARLRQYILPYVESGTTKTWVKTLNADKTISIENRASAWTSYELVAIVFYQIT